jgi:hypothetical protein
MQELARLTRGSAVELDEAEMHRFIDDGYRWLNVIRDQTGLKNRSERDLLNTMRTSKFYGCRVFAYVIEGQAQSFSAIKYQSSPRKNAWGRYLNWYYAYTIPHCRQVGLATELQRWVEETSLGDYQRLKSLAGSWLGYKLHRSLRHHVWGLTEKDELLIDTPLCAWDNGRAGNFPSDTVAYHARGLKQPRLTPHASALVIEWEQRHGGVL